MSISVEDFEVNEGHRKQINDLLDIAESDVQKIIARAEKGQLDVWPGMSAEETRETEIIQRLNRARDETVTIVADQMALKNPATVMAISGARGTLLNVGLIAGSVGQQAIGGGRPKRGYYSNRTFPHFKPFDVGAKSKGFVRNAYGTGLDPFDFFWVSASGREGLTDTGVKTPKSGYMYRRLSNALQDLRVEADHTVRDSGGTIVQFKYGEDGIDVSKSDRGFIDFNRLADIAMARGNKK